MARKLPALTCGPKGHSTWGVSVEGKGDNLLQFLIALYAISGLLHFLLVAKHRVEGNVGTLVFGFIYAALALAVYLNLPYALWIGLALTLIGLTGLSLNFIGIAKTVATGVVFWAVDAVVVLLTLYLLFG
jgi:hypothetical protein